MRNPAYQKLLDILTDNVYGEPVQLAWGEAEDIVKAIWPTVVDLLATNAEYVHALEHVADRKTHTDHSMTFCEDCMGLAQSALDGVNRDGFKEMIVEDGIET